MADPKRFIQKPVVSVEAIVVLTEDQMGALEALAGYGTDKFLECFYANMGKAYLSKHEAGLRSLFELVRQEVPSILSRANDARMAFNSKGTNP